MNRLIKLPLRVVWRLMLPVRGPVVRRLEEIITRCTAHQQPQPQPQTHVMCEVSAETGVLMDHMIRELVRLQSQVDLLRRAVEEIMPSKTGLAVVSELD